jgi:hypothetical protein
MDVVEVGWGDVDWIRLAQDRDSEFGIEPSGCWWERQREGGQQEDQDVGGLIILGWIL